MTIQILSLRVSVFQLFKQVNRITSAVGTHRFKTEGRASGEFHWPYFIHKPSMCDSIDSRSRKWTCGAQVRGESNCINLAPMNDEVAIFIHSSEHCSNLVMNIAQALVGIVQNLSHPIYRSLVGFRSKWQQRIPSNCACDCLGALPISGTSLQSSSQRV